MANEPPLDLMTGAFGTKTPGGSSLPQAGRGEIRFIEWVEANGATLGGACAYVLERHLSDRTRRGPMRLRPSMSGPWSPRVRRPLASTPW